MLWYQGGSAHSDRSPKGRFGRELELELELGLGLSLDMLSYLEGEVGVWIVVMGLIVVRCRGWMLMDGPTKAAWNLQYDFECSYGNLSCRFCR